MFRKLVEALFVTLFVVSVNYESEILKLTKPEPQIEIEQESYSDMDVFWLSRVIYAEAGADNCSNELQLAVGSVVLNRVESELYPNTIEYMLGDYAKVAPVGMICRGDRQKDAEAASPTLAGLKGKRFVTMSESNEYGKLDEEKIKQLTGGEEISARKFNSEMERHPEWFDRKSTSSGFVIYWGLKMKEVM